MKIVDYIKECKYPIVCESSIGEIIENIHHDSFSDARSAAFFAFGKSLKEKKPVVLLVNGIYLSSVYTAITEAWFQKANVIVLSLFDSLKDMKTSYLDRCVVYSISIEENEFDKSIIEHCETKKGPCLINVLKSDTKIDNRNDYQHVITSIISNNPRLKIIAYNCESNNVVNIDKKYKYGVVSKYIGMSLNDNMGVLLCNRECLDVDMSVFRTRYSNSNMKIVVVGKDFSDISSWIESNGWTVFNSIDNINEFLITNSPSVMFVKEG